MKLFHKEMMILAVAPLYLLSGSRGGLVEAAKALTLLREGLARHVFKVGCIDHRSACVKFRN